MSVTPIRAFPIVTRTVELYRSFDLPHADWQLTLTPEAIAELETLLRLHARFADQGAQPAPRVGPPLPRPRRALVEVVCGVGLTLCGAVAIALAGRLLP